VSLAAAVPSPDLARLRQHASEALPPAELATTIPYTIPFKWFKAEIQLRQGTLIIHFYSFLFRPPHEPFLPAWWPAFGEVMSDVALSFYGNDRLADMVGQRIDYRHVQSWHFEIQQEATRDDCEERAAMFLTALEAAVQKRFNLEGTSLLSTPRLP
jgi:hypothetical protein